MLKKIFKFVSGYVIIRVTGDNSERFINMCMHNRVKLYEIVPVESGHMICMKRRDFLCIRRIVYKCGVRVKIVSKHGLHEVFKAYKYRHGFFVCGIMVCIFFLVIPQYIWCVEIDGVYEADTDKIIEVLRECGVYNGAPKKDVAELFEIKDAVLRNVDELNWAWLYIDGSKARLEVQEKVPAPAINDMHTPTDIIAVNDGFVRSAVVTRGERRVNEGVTVTAGQVLVSGKVAVFKEGYPEKYDYVHSQGEIIADTVRSESGRYTATEKISVKTGNSSKRFSLEIFGKKFDLFKDISCGYDEYNVMPETYDLSVPILGYMGISVVMNTVEEIKITEHKLDEDEILSRAKEDLEEKICKKLGVGAVKTDEEINYTVDNDIYNVELRMYFRENIGIEVPTEE